MRMGKGRDPWWRLWHAAAKTERACDAMLQHAGAMCSELSQLVIPLRCGGCGAPGQRWCLECDRSLRRPPRSIRVRVNLGVPVWSLGPYGGPRGQAIVMMKERGRTDLIAPLSAALDAGIQALEAMGEVPFGATLVPAPTRLRSERKRGGDPVYRMCLMTHRPTVQALRLRWTVADSAGLSARQRWENMRGGVQRIHPVTGPVILVDDVVTTGATVAASVAALREAGAEAVAVLTLAYA